MDQGRDYGKVSEALVSGVEFKEVPQNLAINQEKYFDKMFQKKITRNAKDLRRIKLSTF